MSEARQASTYLITFSCYGQRLHGDEAGSVDRNHNQPGSFGVPVDHRREVAEKALMTASPYVLDDRARPIVLKAIQQVCEFRGWSLAACHVRTTHVHTVVSTRLDGDRAMRDFKSYASRALNEIGEERTKRWARGGSVRRLVTDKRVTAAIQYVVDGQGTPMAVYWRFERSNQPLPHGRGSENSEPRP